MKKLILSTLLFALAFTASAQLNNIRKQSSRDTAIGKLVLPIQDTLSKLVYKISPEKLVEKSIISSGLPFHISTVNPTADSIPLDKGKLWYNSTSDSVAIYINRSGVLKRLPIQ